jgi:hypothetical protein
MLVASEFSGTLIPWPCLEVAVLVAVQLCELL